MDCLVTGRTADYDRKWRQLTRRYRLLTEALVRASAHQSIRTRLVPAAVALPRVFGHAVNQLAY